MPLPPSTPQQRLFATMVLLAGVVCMGMGQSVIFAVLPPLARKIGMPDLEVLSIFMLSAVFWVLIGPAWGRRSDRFGRKPFIILGLSGYAVSMTAFALAIGLGLNGILSGLGLYLLLIATRSIYGVVGSATPGAAQAYIADRTPPERRTAGMSSFSAAFGIGAMMGPAFGGAFAAIGPLAPLFAVAALAALTVVLVWRFLPERTPPKARSAAPRLSPTDPRIRSFLIFGLATGVATSIPVQFIAFYAIDRIGLAESDALQLVGIALSAAAMAALFSQLVLVQRFNLRPAILMRAGPALIVLGHLVIAAATDVGPLVFGMMLSGLGGGLLTPGFVGGASLSVGSEEQGAAAGLSNAAGASGFIFAPLIGHAFYSIAPAMTFVATATIAAGAAAFALFDRRLSGAVAAAAGPAASTTEAEKHTDI